jgi:UTP-glucose-1-phosphate uridylyltransferase
LNGLIDSIRIVPAFREQQLAWGTLSCGRVCPSVRPFVCLLLGDTIFRADAARLPAAGRAFGGGTVIGLDQSQEGQTFSIVGGQMIEPGILKLDTLVEKPARQSPQPLRHRRVTSSRPPSSPVWNKPNPARAARSSSPIARLQPSQVIHGVVLSARRHDIGNPLDWLKTNLIRRRDSKLWEQLHPTIDALIDRAGVDDCIVRDILLC